MLKNITMLLLISTISYTAACESPKQELTQDQIRLAVLKRAADRKESERVWNNYYDVIHKHEQPDFFVDLNGDHTKSRKIKSN